MNPYTGQVYAVDPTTGYSQVPPSQITPLATLVMAALPLPNVAGASNNYVSLPRGSLVDDKGDARYDGYFTAKLTGFFRFSERNVNIFDPPNIPGVAGGNSNSVVKVFNQQEAFGVTYAVSNNSLIDARVGISLVNGSKQPPNIGEPSLLAEAGIPNIPTDPRIVGPLNSQNVNNFSTFGRQTTSPNVQDPFVVNPKINYSLLRGTHSLKFGYDYQHISVADDDFHPKYGNDTYSGAFSTPPPGQFVPTPAPSSTLVNQAIALTDFFFGARSHYELNNIHLVSIQQRLHQWYAQDDWRLRQKLTVNIGLRYELGTPEWEANNQLANFDPSTSPATGLLITARPGSIYNRALVNMQKNNFAPRVGFAYEPRPGTSIRAGYGISYTHFVREGGENLLVYNAPFTFNAQVNQRGPLAANPQPLCTSLSQNPATCFRTTMQGYANGFTDASNFNPVLAQPHYQPKHDPNGYAEAWHLTVQQQIEKNIVFEIAYVGVSGKHLPTLADYNAAAPQPSTCLTNNSTCLTVQARRPIQSFAGIEIAFGAGDSIYHALQAKLEHRYANGLFLLNSFTWSHAIDNASGTLENNNGDTNRNPNYDRGRLGYDQPINDTTSVIYDLPYGVGRRFGQGANPILKHVLGNWQVTAINSVTSGLPINLTYSAGGYKLGTLASDAFALTAGAASSGTLYAQRPNIVANPINPSKNWVKTSSALNGHLNPAAVVLPTDPSQPLGNAGRNPTRAPGFSQLDLGVHKVVGLWREDTKLDFRAEAFNVLNQVNYQAPDGTRTDGGYGSITSAYPARQLQFAAKVLF